MRKNLRRNYFIVILMLFGSWLGAVQAASESTGSPDTEALLRRIEQLEQKTQSLEAEKQSLEREKQELAQQLQHVQTKNEELAAAGGSGDMSLSESEELDSTFFEMSLDELMTVEVASSASLTEASDRLTPSTVTRISKEDIKNSGARNLIELLDMRVPNFQWISHWNSSRHMGLRGITSQLDDKYLLVVNGKVMNLRTSFGVFSERDLPVLTDIYQIEVVRGPGSVLYGPGALAMVISITTDSAKSFQGEQITARAGGIEDFYSVEYKRGTKLGKDEGLFFYAGAGQYDGASIKDSPVILGRASDAYLGGPSYPTGHEFTNYFQSLNGSYDNWPKYKLHAQYYKGPWEIWFRSTQGGEVVDNPWPGNSYQGMGYQQSTLYTSYKQEVSKDLKFTYSLGYDRIAIQSKGDIREDYIEEEYYGKILGQWKLNESHQVAFGSEISHEIFGQHNTLNNYGSYWRFPAVWTPEDGWVNPMDQWDTTMYSLFGEYQWNLSDQWTVFGGGRMDYHEYTDPMFSPRGVLVYTPNDQDTIKFMASKSVRTNNAAEMKIHDNNTGEPSEVETLKAYELRYERQHNDNLWLATSAFLHDQDVIGWIDWATGMGPLGRFKSWGLEAEVSYKKDKLRLDLSHGYTKLIKTDISDEVDLTVFESTSEPMDFGNDFANWSNHTTKLNAQYDVDDKWSLMGSLNIYWGFPGGKDFAEYRNSLNSNDYTLGYDKPFEMSAFLNLGATYHWDKNTELQFYGYNLLGLFDDDLNIRRSAYAIYWPGLARYQTPAVGVQFTRKF